MKGDVAGYSILAFLIEIGVFALIAVAGVVALNFFINIAVLFLFFRYVKLKIKGIDLLLGGFAVTVAGFVVDITVYLAIWTAYPLAYILHFAAAFIGIGLFNYWFAKRYFKVKEKNARMTGIIMGIVTNPVWLEILLMAILGSMSAPIL